MRCALDIDLSTDDIESHQSLQIVIGGWRYCMNEDIPSHTIIQSPRLPTSSPFQQKCVFPTRFQMRHTVAATG